MPLPRSAASYGVTHGSTARLGSKRRHTALPNSVNKLLEIRDSKILAKPIGCSHASYNNLLKVVEPTLQTVARSLKQAGGGGGGVNIEMKATDMQ